MSIGDPISEETLRAIRASDRCLDCEKLRLDAAVFRLGVDLDRAHAERDRHDDRHALEIASFVLERLAGKQTVGDELVDLAVREVSRALATTPPEASGP